MPHLSLLYLTHRNNIRSFLGLLQKFSAPHILFRRFISALYLKLTLLRVNILETSLQFSFSLLPINHGTERTQRRSPRPPPFYQIRSVTQSCPTLCNPMNRSTSGFPIHHQLPEFTQTHVHHVSDAIQPSHPLASPSPSAPNPSQQQSFPMSQLFA